MKNIRLKHFLFLQIALCISVLSGCSNESNEDKLDKINSYKSEQLVKQHNAIQNWETEDDYSINYIPTLLNKTVLFKGRIKDIFRLKNNSTMVGLIYSTNGNQKHFFFGNVILNKEQCKRIILETDHNSNRTGTFIIRINNVQPQDPTQSFIFTEEQTGEDTYEDVASILLAPLMIKLDAEMIDFHIDIEDETMIDYYTEKFNL